MSRQGLFWVEIRVQVGFRYGSGEVQVGFQ